MNQLTLPPIRKPRLQMALLLLSVGDQFMKQSTWFNHKFCCRKVRRLLQQSDGKLITQRALYLARPSSLICLLQMELNLPPILLQFYVFSTVIFINSDWPKRRSCSECPGASQCPAIPANHGPPLPTAAAVHEAGPLASLMAGPPLI